MRDRVIQVISTLLSGVLVCLFAWFGGFDFNERGSSAFLVAWISFIFMFLVWIYFEI